ncbi:MAG TPA: YciI family protein [Propionibacteriaceae bacterium]|nr:YciI family protein [Propionibacteriaceae bacterium]
MKYLLLSYTPIAEWDSSDPDIPSPEALEAFAMYEKFQDELMASGELVATDGLGHPSMSRTLRKQADAVVVTDGPFAELKEVLASYAVVDCSGYDRAVEIARQVVAAIGDIVEIRPIMGEDYIESTIQT